MEDPSSLSFASIKSGQPRQLTAVRSAENLEQDNTDLRQKLHELRGAKAQLISENHNVVSEVEELKYELHRMASHLQPLEENVEKYRKRTNELSVALVEVEKCNEVRIRECREADEKYRKCSVQVTQLDYLVQQQAKAIQSLKQELSDLSVSKAAAEADRSAALDAAEQMRQYFVDFQRQLQARLSSTEDQLSKSYDEREKLLTDLIKRCVEAESLQKRMEQIEIDATTERSLLQSLELQKGKLLDQLKDYSTQIEKIKSDLSAFELMKTENLELKANLDEKCVTISSYEAELRENQLHLVELESLAHTLQKKMVLSLNSQEVPDDVDNGCVAATSKRDLSEADKKLIEKEAVIDQLRLQLARAEKELQQKSFTFASNDKIERIKSSQMVACRGADDRGVLPLENGKTVDEWEESVQRLEEERQKLMAVNASLERKISDLEVVKASLDAQLSQRNAQLDELQWQTSERALKETANERACRKNALQIAALEKQLDEKTAQVAELICQKSDLHDTLQLKSEELRKLERQVKERDREASSNGEAVKQMCEKRCKELKLQLETTENTNQTMANQLKQTENRVTSLQQTLNEMNFVTNSLRQELQQSSWLLFNQKEESEKKLQQMEAALDLSQEEQKTIAEKLQVAEQQKCSELSKVSKQISFLEEERRKLVEAVEEKGDQVKMLEKELKEKQALLAQGSYKLDDLENALKLVRKEREEKEHALCQDVANLKVSLESSERKLGVATTDIERREQQVRDLTLTIRDLQIEKKKTFDEIGNELKEALKQLKTEKREKERQSSEMAHLQSEMTRLADQLQERQEHVEELQQRLSISEAGLKEKSQAFKDLLGECEKLKTGVQGKEFQLAESETNFKCKAADLQRVTEQLESAKLELRRSRDELRSRQSEVEELNQELEQRQWNLQLRAAQVTQLDMAMKECTAESEQKVIRLEGLLKKYQLEAQQMGKQADSLNQQLNNVMAAYHEKSRLLHESEQVIGKLKADFDGEKERMLSQNEVIESLRLEKRNVELVNQRTKEQLQISGEHLQQLKERLDKSEQKLITTQAEFDRTTKDLADSQLSLQTQKNEMEKLLVALSRSDEERTLLAQQLKHAEKEYELMNDQLNRELSSLRNSQVTSQSALEEQVAAQQLKLKAADDRQLQLVQELKRAAQEVSSIQMELEATRMIANATKETSIIKDAEITRLKAKVNSLGRSLTAETTGSNPNSKAGVVSNHSEFSKGLIPAGDGTIELDNYKLLHHASSTDGSVSLTTSPKGGIPVKEPSRGADRETFSNSNNNNSSRTHSSGLEVPVATSGSEHRRGDGASGYLMKAFNDQSFGNTKDLRIVENNPDSLVAMWKMLQTGQDQPPYSFPGRDEYSHPNIPSFSGSSQHQYLAFDSEEKCRPGRIPAKMDAATTSTGTSDPKRSTRVPADVHRSGRLMEEKLEIQNRIKALIGYKKPARKPTSKTSFSSDSNSSVRLGGISTSKALKLHEEGSTYGSDISSAAALPPHKLEKRLQTGKQNIVVDESDCSLST